MNRLWKAFHGRLIRWIIRPLIFSAWGLAPIHAAWAFTQRQATRRRQQRDATWPRLYFGLNGTDLGGPSVKIKRLAQHFPTGRFCFDAVYSINFLAPHPEVVRHAKMAGIPVVANANGVYYRAWFGDCWESQNDQMRPVYQMADHIFFQSQFSQRGAQRFLGPTTCSHEILYNAVDTNRFCPPSTRNRGSAVRLLVAGWHRDWYRIETALHVLHELTRLGTSAHLTIAGPVGSSQADVAAVNRMRHLALELGINQSITHIGQYTQAHAVRLYQAADILLHTQYNDVCPSVVIEAMACGLPVVYSCSGGTPELVGEHAGVGVPSIEDWDQIHPPDPMQMAVAIQQVMSKIEAYAAAARQRAVTQFDIAPWIEQQRRVILQLVRKEHTPHGQPSSQRK